jgi:hypothetical protein
MEFREFLFYSSAEGFGTEFREIASSFVFWNGIPSCFFFRGRVRNRIPRVFCFTEQAGTLYSVYSVFRGFLLLLEIPNRTHKLTLTYIAPSRFICFHIPVIPSFFKNQLSVLHLISAILSGCCLPLTYVHVQYPYPLVLQNSLLLPCFLPTLIKKKIKFSSYIRKFRVEQLQSHIWGRLPNI